MAFKTESKEKFPMLLRFEFINYLICFFPLNFMTVEKRNTANEQVEIKLSVFSWT